MMYLSVYKSNGYSLDTGYILIKKEYIFTKIYSFFALIMYLMP